MSEMETDELAEERLAEQEWKAMHALRAEAAKIGLQIGWQDALALTKAALASPVTTQTALRDIVSRNPDDFAEPYTDADVKARQPAPHAYEPTEIRYEEGGYVEFVNEDVPYIVRDLNGPAAAILDMKTRRVIGYRVYDAQPAPHADLVEAVARAIYETNPAEDQETDIDGRPLSKPYPISWETVCGYDAPAVEEFRVMARAAIAALSAVPTREGWQTMDDLPRDKDDTYMVLVKASGTINGGWVEKAWIAPNEDNVWLDDAMRPIERERSGHKVVAWRPWPKYEEFPAAPKREA